MKWWTQLGLVKTTGRLGVIVTLLLSASAHAVESDVQQVIAGAGLTDTTVAVLLVDLRTGEALVEINADLPMVPASNMKLLTTAAALTRLGPDFKFATRLSLIPPDPGPSAADRVNVATDQAPPPARQTTPDPLPSLLIRGEGDPAFGDPVLLAQAGYEVDDLVNLWVKAVADTGHQRFDRLLIDDRLFDQVWTHPDWPAGQLARPYCAPVAAINFHENLLAVLPVPADTPGNAPIVQLFPYFPDLRTTNRSTTSNVDDFEIQRADGSNRFVFLGSVRNRRSQPYRASVHDPAMFFAQYFQYKLQQAGVRVNRLVRAEPDDRIDYPRLKVLHELNTTLAGVIDRTNQDSQNMFAEALFKRMGHDLTGEPGSFTNGASAVRLYLRDRLARHVGLTGVRVEDGSGLSPNNRVTARVLVAALRSMSADRTLGPIYLASLAHAGHTGTLRQRLRDLRCEVYGKSGYLGASADYASTFSGYLVRPDGRTYAFSMLFNGFEPPLSSTRIKQVQDQILKTIDESIAAVGS